jgi:hypothetical protein
VQKISITKRRADIGGSIVNRTQMHGKKEKVPAVSIPILGIILTEDEFGALLQDASAYNCFFTDERSKVWEPRFPGVEPIVVGDKFEGAKVTITLEDAEEPLVLKPATVGGIVITCVGAQPTMKCMVSGVPDVHLQTLTFLNKRCTVSILNGSLADRDDRQKELKLDGDGPTVEPPETAEEADGDPTTLADTKRDEEEGMSGLGRQIVNSERKAQAKKKRAARASK